MAIVPKPPKGGFMAGILASADDAVIAELKGLLAAAQAEARELQAELARVREAGQIMARKLDELRVPLFALSQPAEYRLLTRADKIEATDELLRDDCVTWALVAGDLCRGMQYNPDFFVPVRRRVNSAPAAQESGDA